LPRLPALPSRRLPIEVAKRFANTASHERPRGLQTSEPEPGYFKLRLIRRGAWVPAIIWRPCPLILPDPLEETAPGPEDWCFPTARPRPLRARIGEDEVDPLEVWGRGPAIGVQEYRFLLARRQWVVDHAPEEPEANPKLPANLAKLPSLF
jgi:hypothetical protein